MPKNKEELEKIKERVTAFINDEDVTIDGDELYEYAVAAKNGEIEETQERIDYMLRTLIYHVLQSWSADEAVRTYPLAVPYISDFAQELDAQTLYELACYYEYDEKDDKKLFEFSKLMVESVPNGLIGGFALTNYLICRDNCILKLAKCYKDGMGTKRDYVKAFEYYMRYHTDHLTIKWGADCLSETDLEDLFNKMKAESYAGVNYPGLHYALAVMYREGIGTAYNFSKYLYCIDKEKENYYGPKTDTTYLERLEEYRKEYINKDPDGVPYMCVKNADSKDIRTGDCIRMGKYNHRDVLWRVTHIQGDEALIVATDCLESTYIVNGQIERENENYENSSIHAFTRNLRYSLIPHREYKDDEDEIKNEFDFEELLVPDENGDYFFLPSVDDIYKMENGRNDLLAGARLQARINGYRGYGVEFDEENHSAPWWTSDDGGEPGNLVYVGIYGALNERSMEVYTVGIRPAARLKLRKK